MLRGAALKILIAHDVPCDPDSGAAGTVYQISKAFKELGHDVENIWSSDLPHRIKHGNLHYLMELPGAYVKAIKKRIKQGREYDVIQISQPHCFLPAKYVKEHLPDTVLVHKSHGLELNAVSSLKPFTEKEGVDQRNLPRKCLSKVMGVLLAKHSHLAAKYCDGTLVASAMDRDFAVEELGIKPERVKYIPHGVSNVLLAGPAVEYTAERHKKILYVGQFAFLKGPLILARTMNEVLGQKPEITMTWVCDRVHHDAARAMLDPAVLDRVDFLPWMSQEELMKVYDEHGIFLFPSFYEGAGKTSLEAMSRGLCVISSSVGGMKDYIRHGENGFLEKPGDADAFIRRTLELLDDFPLARRISKAAAETAKAYTWRRHAEESVEFYTKLLKIKRG
ncbi:MAG: glycosyltransferase family 4 protein [Candidatus Omnitrophota bacterium]|nr:glycosyltransferase family 4 protein [Candidatus Omnitrophota bacterium]